MVLVLYQEIVQSCNKVRHMGRHWQCIIRNQQRGAQLLENVRIFWVILVQMIPILGFGRFFRVTFKFHCHKLLSSLSFSTWRNDHSDINYPSNSDGDTGYIMGSHSHESRYTGTPATTASRKRFAFWKQEAFVHELTTDSTVVVEPINVTAIILRPRKQKVQIPKWKSFMTPKKK